jgi:ribonuclease-3
MVRDIIGFLSSSGPEEKILRKGFRNLFGFTPRNLYLFKLALCHKSAPNRFFPGQTINNERLEYLGDAVLSSVVADYLYRKFPHQHEGFLTEMRSRIVSRSRLNKLAIKMGIDGLIFEREEHRTTSKSIYGDTFEALLGAVYLDRGYPFTRKMIIRRIIGVYLDIDDIMQTETNFKSRILEYVQREKKTLEFRLAEEIGEGYQKQYRIELVIDGATVTSGLDFSIKGAEQIASEKACEKLFEEH